MIIFQIISVFVFAQDLSEADFPYCFDEFHGTITQQAFQSTQVDYEIQCQGLCMENEQCKTFSFLTSGQCLLFTSGLYEAIHNLEPDLAVKTKSAYRCMFECNRISDETECADAVACIWDGESCAATCENFSNENIKIEECDVQSINCGNTTECSNSTVVGTSDTSLYCDGDAACSNLQVSTMNTVECNECIGGLMDSVDTIIGSKLVNVDIISSNNVICHDCVFDEASILQTSTLRSVAEYGIHSIPPSMQAEIGSLDCVANNACDNIDVHVNRLTCEGPSDTASCSGNSKFTSLGEGSVVRCIGENACAGSSFDGFANVYCIGKGSCENTLFVNIGEFWCFVEDGDDKCNMAVPRDHYHQCLAWTGEECLTAQPSAMPTSPDPTTSPTDFPTIPPTFSPHSSAPSIHPTKFPTRKPTPFSPSLQTPTHKPSMILPTGNPTIFIAVEAATRTCQANEWYDMHLTSCFSCPDGMEPTHTKLDCAQCAGNSAGKGGKCDECSRYFYFPSEDGTKCDLNIVTVVLIVVSGLAFCLSCKIYRRGPKQVIVEPTKSKKPKKHDSKREPKKTKKKSDEKLMKRDEQMEEKPTKRRSLQGKKSEKRKSIEKGRKHSEDRPKRKKSMNPEIESEEMPRETSGGLEKLLERRRSMERRSSVERKIRTSMERGRKSFDREDPLDRRETRKSFDREDPLDRREPLERRSSVERRPSRRKSNRKASASMNRRSEGEPRHTAPPPPRNAAPRMSNWEEWTPTEVGRFFNAKGMRSVGDAFHDARVTGQDLKDLNYADLCDLGFREEEIRRFDEIMKTHFSSSFL